MHFTNPYKEVIPRFSLAAVPNYTKWLFTIIAIGILTGSSSALFLYLLEKVTQARVNHPYLLFALPIGGLGIGLLYHYWGKEANKGNNLIIEQYHLSNQRIPIRIFPLVLLGTLTTHLFGGSAGREGTAVQMGASVADQFTKLLPPSLLNRRILLLMGVSAGFSSLFGTPIAGIVFAFELMLLKNVDIKALLPVVLVSFISHYTCLTWGIEHTIYSIDQLPNLHISTLLKVGGLGLAFGLSAYLFIQCQALWNKVFHYIKYAPLRPFIGGGLFIVLILTIGSEDYLGLGIPVIENAFTIHMEGEVFLLKILFTTLILGAGFKGGEVTPLFFIGATLGSFLSYYFELPISFAAGLGFVAVFAGATKTPLACLCMGVELFGLEYTLYLAVACLIAYFASGKRSIYTSQFSKYSLQQK